MRKKKPTIRFYRDLAARLKPLGVIIGLSTLEEVKSSIKKHRGKISYNDVAPRNPDIRYIFASDLTKCFSLPSLVSEVRFHFYKGILFDMSLIFDRTDELEFFRILRSLKKLYGFPKIILRNARWEYATFWIAIREEREEELMVMEYADRELLNLIGNIETAVRTQG